ncbi:error-prone DNA polymerase [Sphingomonas profundi]|uniref:error-prone DNA polymerase n=1 Tax=Alterirhizorhabdus profundi TaxID=2681549 RepID=UPI0012E948D9|nr:error-prone DNA polymerase [Sphingomonas profundi]
MAYSELQVTTHFSFLRGVSSCDELFAAAALLGLPALGLVDRNSVAGLVRGMVAARATGMRMVAGCRLDLACACPESHPPGDCRSASSLLVWPQDRAGWRHLTRLLTIGKGRANAQKGEKGRCFLHWEDVAAHAGGLVAALVPDLADRGTEIALAQLADIFGDAAHLCLTHRRRPGDALRLHELAGMARRFGVRPLATGDVLHHTPDRRMLQDVVTAIRHGCTIDDLGFRRERHADRHLKGPDEMARRFALHPDAIAATEAIVERCTFALTELDYRYPDELVMSGRTPQAALEQLTRDALALKFPDAPSRYAGLLEHELQLVARLGYAPYFLTVNSIVQFARSQGILCQGRGSAANSMICFVLGITSIDPVRHELLFERFISGERKEPPDIDVDFEHERREEVIQWIYETYGHRHAALTAVVSRFRARGSVREVGKALGLPEDMTGALAGQVWGWSTEGVGDRHVAQLNLNAADPRLALTLDLARQLIGTPRHLSQHPGGFVLTRERLDDLVPIEPAAMADRRVIEWEKEDIEELGFMKVDILGLGMLGCMRRAFDLLAAHKGLRLDLASAEMQTDCPRTFEMIQRADTLGTFQIESRAQMSMLPRLKPRKFYDLVIQVAIVRPGPIQGDMVHPYLRRREGKEKAEYPKPELEAVLKKTYGVPLFQEQAMKVAIVGAGFTPAEADQLRRSMATFKFTGGVGEFADKMIGGMIRNGYERDFAERTFKQIEGFGSYGFPESHAASFAKIAYASSWMKCHHPDIFCAALLNAQPMGFYAPAQIVRDARDHGVEVRPVDVNASRWDCTLESLDEPFLPGTGRGTGTAGGGGLRPDGTTPRAVTRRPCPADGPPARAGEERFAVRLGLRMVRGLSNVDGAKIVAARGGTPFASPEDLWFRSGVAPAAIEKLADADAFGRITSGPSRQPSSPHPPPAGRDGLSRRDALWRVRGLAAAPLPLFAAADAREAANEPAVALRQMTEGREVVEDYRAVQLSLRAHPLAFLRADLARRGVVTARALETIRDGRHVEVAGIILVRQKPGSAKGVLFITIEDETGIANGILWPDRFEAQRRTVLASAMIGIRGRVQREGLVIHVIADHIVDYTPLLRTVGEMDFPHRPGPGDGATHGGSPDRGDPGYKDHRPTDRERTWAPKIYDSYHRAFADGCDPEDAIRVKTRDFH